MRSFCPVDLVLAQDAAREFASAVGVLRHRLIKIILARHHLFDEVTCSGSGSVGDSKNCGGDDVEARDHSLRHHERQQNGDAVGNSQHFSVGKQQCGANSNNRVVPQSMGRQHFSDSNGLLPENELRHPHSKVLPVLCMNLEAE